MNERIRELAEQAGYNPVWSTKADKEEHFDLEKFAELIVKECADTVLGFRNQFGDSAHAEIKQHFGVES